MSKKSSYKAQIIQQLFFSEGLSCSDISNELNKSLPFINGLLVELIDEGIVVETGYAPSSGGRRPLIYSLKTGILYVLAVAMDQFVTRIALMDMQNREICQLEKFDLNLAEDKKALLKLTEKIHDVIEKSGVKKENIAGIGIGMPGFVNAQLGINYTFLKDGNGSISNFLSEHTGLPVFIDNDSSLVALAEFRFGTANRKKNAMVVNLGWGIGLGMVLDEKLFRGNNGFAGEFSHIPLFTNGKLCSCGKYGCLETESSLLIITEKARQGVEEGKLTQLKGSIKNESAEQDCAAVFEAASKGDRFAISLLSDAAYVIGRGLAILIHIINPEMIIISGRGAAAGKLWMAPIQQALNEHCIPKLADNTDLEISALGYEAEIVGAAALVMENYEKVFMRKQLKADSFSMTARL
ncbi:MAG: ROK family protein [Chitinophagaceae bacterium]